MPDDELFPYFLVSRLKRPKRSISKYLFLGLTNSMLPYRWVGESIGGAWPGLLISRMETYR